MSLILASTSPYRRMQLKKLGLHFTATAPKVDEKQLKNSSLRTPAELAAYLALQKAHSLRADFPGHWILGADQLVDFQGEILGKPETEEKARAQLFKLQGRTHQLITAFCLSGPTQDIAHVDFARMHMRPLNEQQVADYVQQDQPLDCAGAYKLENAGISLFEKIESEDFTAIQGLPLIAFTNAWLKAQGRLPFASKESL